MVTKYLQKMENKYASAVFLDRDGVLNKDRPDSVKHRSEFELIEGAAMSVSKINKKGYKVFVATNQACVGRGELDMNELRKIHSYLKSQVRKAGGKIADIYVCTHTDIDDCNCRKPNPGLLLDAKESYNINLRESYFVGDDERDVNAAVAAGCNPIVVCTGKGNQWEAPPDVPVFTSIVEFAERLEPPT